MAKNNIAIYSALYGERGTVTEPTVVPKGCDLIFFTDRDDLTSKHWEVRKVDPVTENPRRASRHPKMLAHKYLAEYEYSVYVDANLEIRGEVSELVQKYLIDQNLKILTFDHKNNTDSRDCVYDEYAALIESEKRGRPRDDSAVMTAQIEKYRAAGYPRHAGLSVTMVILRKHNDPEVIRAMETWWEEYMANSQRDQLSFNYSLWKSGLPITFLPGDSRDNAYFKHHAHRRKTFTQRIIERVTGMFR